ncbi:MAG: ATP synthase F1 subunit delta [Legionellales bacterium RIFCSPHIGHO2_12_FULL_37_14]|nr:MAG: ATP synthase F1 subunit delta [Legionellales bacterium RIFCSPHIGHO2_12_FULL_37_14]
MSQQSVFARPYAKAIFEHAVDAKELKNWEYYLGVLACTVLDTAAKAFITNPKVTANQQVELLLSTFSSSIKEWKALKAWVSLIVTKKRIFVLPEIYLQYQKLRAEYEKTLVVEVFSYLPMTVKQESLLKTKLSKKLTRDVNLKVSVDASLLGGIIIKAGDFVLDGSVKGKLNAMHQGLLG